MADNETIADIIAEKRRDAQHIRNNLSTVPVRRLDQLAEIESLEDEADRLEAAKKREIEATATKCCQLGRLAGYGASEIKHQQEPVGNEAKLREAVKAVVDVGYPHNFQNELPHIREYCYDITEAIKKCYDALATEKGEGANG